MKNYIIQRVRDGILLTCESLDKQGRVVKFVPNGPFHIGAPIIYEEQVRLMSLATAIMQHYFGASPTDPAATAEALRQSESFRDAFLLHHNLAVGGKLEISSDVIDRFFSLRNAPVLA